ncbi:hypothetical protein A2258_02240 [Candidatus Uhrbacteria bacterium RIFOXYA2_FULL_41_8]|nr:MAG: hypothetical protein A2258_02240 [Candidatus Uhrbacteria bacterium RIFOXYA2_FULL_41_8]
MGLTKALFLCLNGRSLIRHHPQPNRGDQMDRNKFKSGVAQVTRAIMAFVVRWTPIIASAIWAFICKWAPIVWSRLVKATVWTGLAIRATTKFVGRLIRTTAIDPLRQATKVWLFGNIWGAICCTLIVMGFTVFYGPVESPTPEEPNVGDVEREPGNPPVCGKDCIKTIRESRAKLRGIEENEAQYVLREYNAFVASSTWRERAESCHKNHWQHFQKAEEMTLYPAAFISGKALIEGAGCRNIAATNGDGGIGPMQITHPYSSHIVAVGRMLGVSKASVDYRHDYLTNVLLGTVMFSDFENQFGSRGVGLLAYNRGPGNVRKDMRRGELTNFKQRTLSDFRGGIPEHAGKGGRPRVYADRVLAGMVMMDRVARNLPLKPLERLTLEDIPGANPTDDGK